MFSTEESDRRSDYVFFGPYGLCIDGSTERCPCHPQTRILGRLLNFARKESVECNVVPRYFSHDKSQQILFVARRDIQPLEELRFDYGDGFCRNIFNWSIAKNNSKTFANQTFIECHAFYFNAKILSFVSIRVDPEILDTIIFVYLKLFLYLNHFY